MAFDRAGQDDGRRDAELADLRSRGAERPGGEANMRQAAEQARRVVDKILGRIADANYYAGLPMQWRKRPKFSMTVNQSAASRTWIDG
jgi:hypothetical protein